MTKIVASDYGAFTNFKEIDTYVIAGDVIGSICMLSVCDPVTTPVDGYIHEIDTHADSRGLVDPGDYLYSIADQPGDLDS